MDRRIDRVFIYILSNKRNGTLYTGLTTNLVRRMEEHKAGKRGGFTKEHGLTTLVYYEIHDDIQAAANRERLLKKWRRIWKIEMIEKQNPNWYDLHEDVLRKWNN
jgi:putative endonuclease